MGYARAWGAKGTLSYARSITAAQVNAVKPTGLAQGGAQWRVYNSGAVPVLFLPFLNSAGVPVMTFPVDGAPPTGQLGTVIAPGAVEIISGFANADSFGAIGQTAGPSIIYVQRGEGI